jgi:hypothetical protein
MVYAVVGAVTDRSDRIGGHLIFLPLAIAIGALLTRVVPSQVRAVTAAAVYVSGVLFVVALPLILGLGRRADDPSALPLKYGRGLLISVAVVWLAAGATLLYRRRRRSVRPPTPEPSTK